MMRLSMCLLLTAVFSLHDTAIAGGWGPTLAIEVRSVDFDEPLTITERSIVDGLSFWVGPGTGYSEFMGPVAYSKSIVNWDLDEVVTRREVLPLYEVRFLLGSLDDPAAYTVYYEPDRANNAGYIYYPKARFLIVASWAARSVISIISVAPRLSGRALLSLLRSVSTYRAGCPA